MTPMNILSFAVMMSPAAIINVITREDEFKNSFLKSTDDGQLFKNNFNLVSNVVIICGALATHLISKNCACPCPPMITYIIYNLLLLLGLILFFLIRVKSPGLMTLCVSACTSLVLFVQYTNKNPLVGLLALPCVVYACYGAYLVINIPDQKEEEATCSCGINNILGESMII